MEDTNSEVQETSQNTPAVTPSIEETNKQLYARAKKAEAELKELRGKQEATPKEVAADPLQSGDEITQVLSLRSKGYSDGEILKFRDQARKRNVPLHEYMSDPYVSAGIEAERVKAKAESATPPSTTRGTTMVGNKPLSEMTKEEMQANWPAIQAKFSGRGKNGNV